MPPTIKNSSFVSIDAQECVVPENIHTPHGGSRKFQGEEGCERGKFPKGTGVSKELLFPEGLKCHHKKRLRTFPTDSR